ncbi:hypothetical protein O7627_13910 [Solwaraspora sp. WMMD1047]|uniref:hypothetical protein n=1 Tax=Solwaraspora sp. WMMD1047 TaxID=3016102 RepID=UPI002416BFD6|nr:hypothetical protein [Solwaraspora sp. WMMD1047]MDG4830395.1 hypothetical protein [Solwaraspora sp. WMMD1047]
MSEPTIAAYHDFNDRDPDETGELAAHWYAPATNFVVVTSRVDPGARLVTEANPDEHCLILPTGAASVRVTASGDEVTAEENTLVVLPPGDSVIEVLTAGHVHRVFSSATATYARAKRYAVPVHPAAPVAPLVPWPDPVDGFRLRRYALAELTHLDGVQRTFRTTNMMIKLAPAKDHRREPTALSPHQHDDFEQASLVVHGEWIHHVRSPWGKDSTTWRTDEHRRVGSPSVTIIPPPQIHTSQSVGPRLNQLIDIFAPPRVDFSLTPGKVTNADEYPMPEGLR